MNRLITIISIAVWMLLPAVTPAQVRLPALVRDSMILQRNENLNIWGWAAPQEKVSIRFKNQTYRTIADANGHWKISLPPMRAGGPYGMKVDASNHLLLKDIWVGDVWLCSGQSNMVHQMTLHQELYKADIDSAINPLIRQFWVPNTTDLVKPQHDLPGGYWKPAINQDIEQFSAVAYFFAKSIFKEEHVPIGLINASVGGSPIEAWMSEKALKDFPKALSILQKNKDTAYVHSTNRAASLHNNSLPAPEDSGMKEPVKWFDPAYTATDWQRIAVPGFWEDQGYQNLDGIVWYRKEFFVPENFISKQAKLVLGRIVDADDVYINGQKIGTTGYQYPQRRYAVPAGVLKAGKNSIVVRVTNNGGKGGFVPDKPYALAVGHDSLSLTGYWQFKPGAVFPKERHLLPTINLFYQPAALFNAMIAPLTDYSVRGILWYQGESNIGNAPEYGNLLQHLIADWRQRWRSENLPFLFVQLPGFGDKQYQPAESNLALLREQQRKTLKVPNTAMAVTIDVGEWNDIHPQRKKEVGERLALAALKLSYGENRLVASGPLLQSAQRNRDTMILNFTNTGSGLMTADGKKLQEFAIAAADKNYVWAKTKIEADKIRVWSDDITDPQYVRYAWADTPVNPNLYNKEGLPASPFEAKVESRLAGGPWKGKKAAVVLTYDDALNVDLTHVIPALNEAGLKGTFYISDYFGGLKAQIPGWKKAAAAGHELANHTLFHPCAGSLPGRSFVQPDYDLDHYTVRRMKDEISAMNNLLFAIDGKTRRTFAFPCGDTKIHDSAFVIQGELDMMAARAVRSEMPTINKVDLFNLPAYMINGESGEQLINLVNQAREKNALLVFLFHGVGGEHSLNVSLEAHRQLLDYLKNNQQEIWTATMIEVAEFIMEQHGL